MHLRLVALTAVALLATARPAVAQSSAFDDNTSQRPTAEVVDDEAQIGLEVSGGSPGSSTPSSPPSTSDEPADGFERAIWLFSVGGVQCWRVVSVPVSAAPVTIPAGTPPCDPAAPATITPEEWVRTYVETTAPQRPEPGFVPPNGLTGEPMYLVTVAPTTWLHETADTPFGPLTIVGEATVVVDWGDGGDPLRYPVAGEPWPDGQIVHTWTTTGTYDVTVRYEWDLDWSFASASGQLDLPHTEILPAYPVTELQPVIRRP